MPPRLSYLLVAGLSGFLGLLIVPASAISWRNQAVHLTTAPFQKTIEATFSFENDSPQSLAILDVQTTCDCLSATANQKIYAPGETGVITSRFTVGDRLGLYERKITVLTDINETPIFLSLSIEVPALAIVTPQTLRWAYDEPPQEKSLEIQSAGELSIAFTDVQTTSEAFSARLETITTGKHYRVFVQPKAAHSRANTAIRISGLESTGHRVEVSGYANIQ